nr:RNA-binding transcriptional accessory protein [Saprospiraceae bacterium]
MQQAVIRMISDALGVPARSVSQVLQMMDEGATVPFIARYRKERTGGLDEIQLGKISREKGRMEDLQKRKLSILKAIEEQEKLTPELRKKIENCWEANLLEDLYLPFKKKRKTRAAKARELGLEPLAIKIYRQGHEHPGRLAAKYLNQKVSNVEEALKGAVDIISEWINEDPEVRELVRQAFRKSAILKAKVIPAKKGEAGKYSDYFDHSEKLSGIPSHRLLAIYRGETEGYLRISVQPDEERLFSQLERKFIKFRSPSAGLVKGALYDGYKRLTLPSIENEFRNLAKRKADEEAIDIFAENLRQLLLAPPLGPKNILAIDPAFRTGCKTVCLDSSGQLLWHGTLFPHEPQKQTERSAEEIIKLVDRYKVEAIAVGNGTAGRETLDFLAEIEELKPTEVYLISEAGASIYSASEVAIEEFPHLDLTVRGAVSIGRRLMDPLAELVKLDPKHIGVGQYQHDVDQTLLKERLTAVVEYCVNSVGINLQTASKHLLSFVSGLGPGLSESIVNYRSKIGKFESRAELLKVPRLGPVAYQQAAGFLRIPGSKNPLDNTAVHPERYALVKKMSADLGIKLRDMAGNSKVKERIKPEKYTGEEVGLPTIRDILSELEKPGLDPRGVAEVVKFSPVREIADIRPGMEVNGVVTNLAKFGAFVDIGIKQNGMIHISQITDRYISNPAEVLLIGQAVKVRVLDVDVDRGRVSLTMKSVEQ